MASCVLQRVYEFNGVRLPEISKDLSPEETRTVYEQIRLVV